MNKNPFMEEYLQWRRIRLTYLIGGIAMNKKTFIHRTLKLWKINNQICKVNDALRINLFEGPVGQLFDLAFDSLLPIGSPDSVFEDFGNLFWSNDISEEEVAEFYDSLF